MGFQDRRGRPETPLALVPCDTHCHFGLPHQWDGFYRIAEGINDLLRWLHPSDDEFSFFITPIVCGQFVIFGMGNDMFHKYLM